MSGPAPSASERRVLALAAVTYELAHVEAGEGEGGLFTVTVCGATPPLRGSTVQVRVAHAKPGTAWRMALRRVEAEATRVAARHANDADGLAARAERHRSAAQAIRDVLFSPP